MKQNGIALVIVLWLLMLLTIMATSYSTTMRTETILATHLVQTAQAKALAEAGIWRAVFELLNPDEETAWKTDGREYEMEITNGTVRINILDENGKIDLNTAMSELLYGLVKSAGADESERLKILHALLDWRDRDSLVRNFGAEDDDYANAGYEYGAKDGMFNTIEELQQVMGMTPELYRKMRPALTVHSHQTGINPTYAPNEVLFAIPGADAEAILMFLATRYSTDTVSSSMLPGVDGRFFSLARGRVFTKTAHGSATDSSYRLEAVVILKRDSNPPFTVLSWEET